MADTKIRIELDAEGAKQKLKRFDEDREKARKKTAKAEKRQAAKAKREKRDGALTAAAGVVVAIKSPKLSAIQKRAEEAGGTIKVASQMITKLSALVSAAEVAGDTVSMIAGALEAVGPLSKMIAGPLRRSPGGSRRRQSLGPSSSKRGSRRGRSHPSRRPGSLSTPNKSSRSESSLSSRRAIRSRKSSGRKKNSVAPWQT